MKPGAVGLRVHGANALSAVVFLAPHSVSDIAAASSKMSSSYYGVDIDSTERGRADASLHSSSCSLCGAAASNPLVT